MIRYVIFDLDQTLVDTSCSEEDRKNRDWQTVYRKIPEMKIYEGINELLEFLKFSKIPFAIVTKSPKIYCEKVCNNFNINPNFIIGYHDVSRRKPDPEALLLAIKMFEHNIPNELMHIGDDINDIIASKSSGMITVAASWGSTSINELELMNPDFLAINPHAIIDIIRRINSDSIISIESRIIS